MYLNSDQLQNIHIQLIPVPSISYFNLHLRLFILRASLSMLSAISNNSHYTSLYICGCHFNSCRALFQEHANRGGLSIVADSSHSNHSPRSWWGAGALLQLGLITLIRPADKLGFNVTYTHPSPRCVRRGEPKGWGLDKAAMRNPMSWCIKPGIDKHWCPYRGKGLSEGFVTGLFISCRSMLQGLSRFIRSRYGLR